jgi:hypothetical protein
MKNERASSLDDKTDSIAGEKNKTKQSSIHKRKSSKANFCFPQMYERATDTHTHTQKEAKLTLALEVLSSLRFSVGCCMWCRWCGGGGGGCDRNFQKKWNCFASGSLKVLLLLLLLARLLRSSYHIRKSGAQPETEILYVCRHSIVSKESLPNQISRNQIHRGKLVSKPIISVLLLHLNYSSLEDCRQKLIAWTQVLP